MGMWNTAESNVQYMVLRQTFEGWKIPLRSIWDMELVLILKGQGQICIEGETRAVKAGDLIFFQPGILHSLWVEKPPFMLFYGLHFALPEGEPPLPFPPVIHLDSLHRLEPIFRQLYGAYLQRGHLHAWRQNILLQQILLETCSILREREEPMGSVRVQKALAFIHENPYRHITLSDLLAQAGVGKTVFMRDFRHVTGTTPTQYILNLRLENARELLENTELSIGQIAGECGFSDPLYFSRCFQKRFAQSPRQYRKRDMAEHE